MCEIEVGEQAWRPLVDDVEVVAAGGLTEAQASQVFPTPRGRVIVDWGRCPTDRPLEQLFDQRPSPELCVGVRKSTSSMAARRGAALLCAFWSGTAGYCGWQSRGRSRRATISGWHKMGCVLRLQVVEGLNHADEASSSRRSTVRWFSDCFPFNGDRRGRGYCRAGSRARLRRVRAEMRFDRP